jgi:hypothetical protein
MKIPSIGRASISNCHMREDASCGQLTDVVAQPCRSKPWTYDALTSKDERKGDACCCILDGWTDASFAYAIYLYRELSKTRLRVMGEET